MKNYLTVWLIALLTLVLFVAVSFIDAEVIGTTGLKKATFAEKLFTAPVAAAAGETPDSVAPAFEQVNDTTSKNILIIGDSMLEGLNPRLAAYAEANGHRLNSVIWYSSTSEYWGTCDTLKVFLRRFKPDYIFISLGGNELFVKNIEEKRAAYVRNFLDQIGDIPYLWIGPPNWKEDTGINRLIAKMTKPGCFFLSNGMTFEREKDGAHPTRRSAALWFDSIARWMPTNCARPIKMKRPDDSVKARPERVVVLQPKH